ncbi:MAG: hypothetical protein WC658_02330 [Candidatus Omnitrophota bacterium]
MNNDIILTLKSNKENYFTGDNIEFTYTFFNNSPQFVYMLPWGGQYATNWIGIYNYQNQKLQDLPLVIYELKFIPQKDEFIRIEPKQSHSIFIQGKIVKTMLSKFRSKDQKKYEGIFIDFDNSAVYLKEPGVFNIKAFYQGTDDWSKKGKELYNLDNIFVGRLESNEFKIVVR